MSNDWESNLNLAVIGNCNVHFLVTPEGEINYGCMPHMDSDPIFNKLINETPSSSLQTNFSIEIENFCHSKSYYIPYTAILVTNLIDKHGNSIRITDFCPLYDHYNRIYNPPVLIRQIKPIGSPRIKISLKIATSLGSTNPSNPSSNSNSLIYTTNDFTYRLTSDIPIPYIQNSTYFTVLKKLNLYFTTDSPLERDLDCSNRTDFERTQKYWESFTRSLFLPLEWQEEIIRAAITLQLCQNYSTGAIVAALTTSIPESSDNKGRNWDYRFCWVRDSYHTVQSLNKLGSTVMNEKYLEFILNILNGNCKNFNTLKPLYGVFLNSPLEEKIIDGLSGYRNLKPVRIGNGAHDQIQNDTYGSIILSVKQLFFDSRINVKNEWLLFEKLEEIGLRAYEKYDKKDSGIWEFRTKERVHTHSSLMCWVACISLAQISEVLEEKDKVKEWLSKVNEIEEFIKKRAWSKKFGCYISICYDLDEAEEKEEYNKLDEENVPLDASLLLMGTLGLCSKEDKRYIKTVEKIEKSLVKDGFVFRYINSDDFGKPKNSFVICTFWYIDALVHIGRKTEARKLFENVLNYRNRYGILSEGIEIEKKELWGNFPQAYSMVGIINSALKLSKDWESVGL